MAKHTTLNSLFTATADAIRAKKGITNGTKIVADNFPDEIAGISTGVDTTISTDAATASDIRDGKKAYVNGSLITGDFVDSKNIRIEAVTIYPTTPSSTTKITFSTSNLELDTDKIIGYYMTSQYATRDCIQSLLWFDTTNTMKGFMVTRSTLSETGVNSLSSNTNLPVVTLAIGAITIDVTNTAKRFDSDLEDTYYLIAIALV